MNASWSTLAESPLYAEHLLLGASFDDDEPLLAAPPHYGDPQTERTPFVEGCALADLSGMTALLVSGQGSDAFVAAACANPTLAVGECAFGAVVTGDGSIASVPLVARTGDAEYLVWDASERGLMLQPWLSFLAEIEQNGFRPFGSTRVEDASDALVPLLLWGPHAQTILADYVPSIEALPAAGHVANVRLDRIECLVAHLPKAGTPCYLVLVPPAAARLLWRSLLSFAVVDPVGTTSLGAHARATIPWVETVLDQSRIELGLDQLLTWELAREEGGFVGQRALLA